MFKNKSKDEILEFFKTSSYKIAKFNKNEIIAIEGSPCESIGLVLSGNIDVKRMLGNNTILLSSFTCGNFFGEIIAFSDANTYPATVISSTPSEVLFIYKDDFIKFCTYHPDFLTMFLNELTNKIIKLNKSITNLSLSSIRHKICNYLLNECHKQNSLFININMTKQKLSEVLGIPRPSLSRELIKMKEDNLIDYSKDFIKILDKDKIESILIE